MNADSTIQMIGYQRSIGALPRGPGFSIRTHWGGSLSGLGGSVRKYIGYYKGITTYIKVVGFQGVEKVAGTIEDMLNGSNANDPSQSATWNAVMIGIRDAFNQANSTGWQTVSMQSFTISSPAYNGDPLALASTLFGEAMTTGSVTASGQCQIDISTGANIQPDPRPVFDWIVVISYDSSAAVLTLGIAIAYDHMESNSLLEGIVGAIVGVILYYIGLGEVFDIAGGIAVGDALTGVYNAAANSRLLDALAGPLSGCFWVPPIQLTCSRPSTTEIVFYVKYQFEQATRNVLIDIANGVADPELLATVLNLPAPTVTTATGSNMWPGQTLKPGQSIGSSNGGYTFVMQPDGNLVLYTTGGAALWATGTSGAPVVECVMQTDGNFVLYDSTAHVIWASSTSGNPGAYLTVQNDGNTVIYSGAIALWATNTVQSSVGVKKSVAVGVKRNIVGANRSTHTKGNTRAASAPKIKGAGNALKRKSVGRAKKSKSARKNKSAAASKKPKRG